jgi:integrase-like protein
MFQTYFAPSHSDCTRVCPREGWAARWRERLLPRLSGVSSAAGLGHVTFHALRQTFASSLLQRGASLHYVKDQMSHSSIQVKVDMVIACRVETSPGSTGWTPKQGRNHPQPADEGDRVERLGVIENVGGPTRTRTWGQRIMRRFRMISATCWTDGRKPCNPFSSSRFTACIGAVRPVPRFAEMHEGSPQKSPQSAHFRPLKKVRVRGVLVLLRTVHEVTVRLSALVQKT